MGQRILIKDGLVVTNNSNNRIEKMDILIEEDRIVEIKPQIDSPAKIISAKDKVVIPGFIQTHVHLTQTLFRGKADDLELLDWLKNKIWPFEGEHTKETNYLSAKLGISELIKCGTTSIIDMGTVNHQDAIFEAVYESGIRGISGKCMMDYGDELPKGLLENTEDSVKESTKLLEAWHNKGNGRIKYAFAPRFAISCTEELLKRVGQLSQEYGVMVHTHASENMKEVERVERERGLRNIVYFDKLGLTGGNLILAHCIWLDDEEMRILKDSGTKVSHCPNSNLKLASGIAKVPEMIEQGINVSLGADGAPCNNNLNIFREMRSSALIQKARLLSPTVMPADTIFKMATVNGAKAMGQEDALGSIEVGKKADIVILDLNKVETLPNNNEDIISTIVHSADRDNVETVLIDGKIVLENGILTTINEKSLINQLKNI